MSWEGQGRQERGRFGHGTGGGPDAAGAVAGTVGGAALERVVPVWAARSGLPGAAFAGEVTGAGPMVSAALQAAGGSIETGRDGGALREASAHLARAVAAGGPEWRFVLRSAAGRAGDAGGASDAGSAAKASGAFVVGATAPAATLGAMAARAAPLALSGPWGLAAVAALGAGVA